MKNLLLLLWLILSFLCVDSNDSCSTNLDLFGLSTCNTISFHCVSVWDSQNFILRYKQTATGLWTFVLSTPDRGSWAGMGFSESGRMVVASAVVGWPTSTGGMIKQYYLKGYNQSMVLPDQGTLSLANMTIVSLSSRLYLAFQLKVGTPLSKVIYAVGPDGGIPSSNGILEEHKAEIVTTLDYNTDGGSSSPNAAPTPASGNPRARNFVSLRYYIILGLLAAAFLW